MKAVTDINSYRLAVAIVALLLALSTPVVLADDQGFTKTYN